MERDEMVLLHLLSGSFVYFRSDSHTNTILILTAVCLSANSSFSGVEINKILRGFVMNKKYICYCGLYCENCAVKAKVEPASKVLYEEMKKAGFEDIIHFIPDGEGFWRFLKSVSQEGACISCQEDSGNPGCTVRICAL